MTISSLSSLATGLALLSTVHSIPTTLSKRQSNIWQPEQSSTWDYHLLEEVNTPSSVTVDVIALDLFDNDASVISSLRAAGKGVICYFSAGSWEDYREDWTNPAASDLGGSLDPPFQNELWVDIRSPTVRAVMTERIALAAEKGCDGVDPDNIDGYNNDNGLDLEDTDSIDFVRFLANEAHARGLAIGLKNSLDIIDALEPVVEFAVNEQCHEFEECDVYESFVETGKPVFHVEYPKGEATNNNPVDPEEKADICNDPAAARFSTIMKNLALNSFIEFCNA